MNTEQERADFEAWHIKKFGKKALRQINSDNYAYASHQSRWEAYQAGRAALQSQATEAFPCRIIEADFETGTVTLEMQGKYTVSAGQKYLCDAALQSQDREDAIPAEIRLMAERIAADDFEHCTADPIFTVEKHRVITGIDTDYTDQVGWFDTDSGFRIADDEAESLEGNYSDTGEEPEGYVRTGYLEEWEHCATFITMQAAQEFAKAKGENYRVYVDSGCRNHEWKALRAFLLSIDHARRVEGDGE